MPYVILMSRQKKTTVRYTAVCDRTNVASNCDMSGAVFILLWLEVGGECLV